MSRAAPAVTELLDDAFELALRAVPPWAGVLWATAAPARMLQAHLCALFLQLGSDAHRHGSHLLALANVCVVLVLLQAWGRAVYVRACGFGLRQETVGWREGLRVPLGPLLAALHCALLLEAAFWAIGWMMLPLPLLLVLSGLTSAALTLQDRLSLVGPLRSALGHARPLATVLGLSALFALGFLAALVNLYALLALGFWLARAVPGFDVAGWAPLLELGQARFTLSLLVGATLVVEPLWLATWVAYLNALRVRQSGEDLRLWFRRLQAQEREDAA